MANWWEIGAPVSGPVTPKGPMVSQDLAEIGDARDEAKKSLDTAQAAERFVDLNKETGTGGLRGLKLPWGLGGVPDIIAAADPNFAAMRSITSSVAPGLRPPGSGSSSDKDTKMYVQGFPNVEALGNANVMTAKRLQDTSDQRAARAAFLDTWMQKKGSLSGADAAFNDFWSKRQASKTEKNAALKAKSASSKPQILSVRPDN
jgi:hypothetical protein